MRKILAAIALSLAIAVPASAAHAGLIVEGSVGKGYIVDKSGPTSSDWTQTNVMLAPGVTLIGTILRLQLGLVGDLPDVKDSKFALQLRPMITVKPPLLPIHGRLIFAVQNLNHDAEVAAGAAGGLNISVFGIGVFAEVGVLPTFGDSKLWPVEGRVGASLAF